VSELPEALDFSQELMAIKERRTSMTSGRRSRMNIQQSSAAGEPQTPPEGLGPESGGSDAYEEAAEESAAPVEGEGAAETAALAEVPEALAFSQEVMAVYEAIREALQERVMDGAAAQSLDDLSGAGNIQGVALSMSDEAGGNSSGGPGELALTVFVAESSSPQDVRAVLAESMGIQAAASEDTPLNVEVTGLIDAQPHRFRIRPAPGGVSVAHFRVTAGTIGCLAVGRTPPRNSRRLILSNNHVLANSNNAVFGQCITQPGPADGGQCPRDQIAILERFVPINFAGGANFVDCATGWAWPDRVRPELVYLSGGRPVYFRISRVPVAPALGMLVGKTGRTTQLTQGRIVGVGATIRVNYGGGRVALFQDQIVIRGTSGGFSAGGDSGSSIWTWNPQRNPVGLLFAGGGGLTFANRMTRVLAALDINLFT
jgi:hypothetical protein